MDTIDTGEMALREPASVSVSPQVALARTRSFSPDSLVLTIAVLLTGLTFAPLFVKYWQEWTASESPFGYGYFVPPSVAVYIWCIRHKLSKVALTPPRSWAWPLLLGSVFVEWIGLLSGVTLIQGAALLGVLYSLTQLFWGPARTRLVAPALIYLAVMVPWPGQLMGGVFFRMQHWSVVLSSQLLALLGTSPSSSGSTIYLSHYTFQVAPACAGLTILFPTVACTIFTGMMLDAQLARKLLLVVLSVPLCILVNAFRIMLVGVIGNQGGADLAAKLHDMSGWVGVVICVLILSGIGSLIGCAKYKPEFVPKWAREEEEQP